MEPQRYTIQTDREGNSVVFLPDQHGQWIFDPGHKAGPGEGVEPASAEGCRGLAVVRDEGEIEDLMCRCYEAVIDGTRFPDMTYEQGILAAVKWLTEADEDDNPMEDEECENE